MDPTNKYKIQRTNFISANSSNSVPIDSPEYFAKQMLTPKNSDSTSKVIVQPINPPLPKPDLAQISNSQMKMTNQQNSFSKIPPAKVPLPYIAGAKINLQIMPKQQQTSQPMQNFVIRALPQQQVTKVQNVVLKATPQQISSPAQNVVLKTMVSQASNNFQMRTFTTTVSHSPPISMAQPPSNLQIRQIPNKPPQNVPAAQVIVTTTTAHPQTQALQQQHQYPTIQMRPKPMATSPNIQFLQYETISPAVHQQLTQLSNVHVERLTQQHASSIPAESSVRVIASKPSPQISASEVPASSQHSEISSIVKIVNKPVKENGGSKTKAEAGSQNNVPAPMQAISVPNKVLRKLRCRGISMDTPLHKVDTKSIKPILKFDLTKEVNRKVGSLLRNRAFSTSCAPPKLLNEISLMAKDIKDIKDRLRNPKLYRINVQNRGVVSKKRSTSSFLKDFKLPENLQISKVPDNLQKSKSAEILLKSASAPENLQKPANVAENLQMTKVPEVLQKPPAAKSPEILPKPAKSPEILQKPVQSVIATQATATVKPQPVVSIANEKVLPAKPQYVVVPPLLPLSASAQAENLKVQSQHVSLPPLLPIRIEPRNPNSLLISNNLPITSAQLPPLVFISSSPAVIPQSDEKIQIISNEQIQYPTNSIELPEESMDTEEGEFEDEAGQFALISENCSEQDYPSGSENEDLMEPEIHRPMSPPTIENCENYSDTDPNNCEKPGHVKTYSKKRSHVQLSSNENSVDSTDLIIEMPEEKESAYDEYIISAPPSNERSRCTSYSSMEVESAKQVLSEYESFEDTSQSITITLPKSKKNRKQFGDPTAIANEEMQLYGLEGPMNFSNWEFGVGKLKESGKSLGCNEFHCFELTTPIIHDSMRNTKPSDYGKKKIGLTGEIAECENCGKVDNLDAFIMPNICSFYCLDKYKNSKNIALLDDCVPVEETASIVSVSSTSTNLPVQSKPAARSKENKRKFIKTEPSFDIEIIMNKSKKRRNSVPTSVSGENTNPNYDVFCWERYLKERNEVNMKAPSRLFKNPFPSTPNLFAQKMKLEAIDPENQSIFCVCTVVQKIGFRLKLHFDGYSEKFDFWVNCDSPNIFPAGFCEKTNRTLFGPPEYKKNFSWNKYMKDCGPEIVVAPEYIFFQINQMQSTMNPFRNSQKLEVYDYKWTQKLMPATIQDIFGDRILIHFDGLKKSRSLWMSCDSPHLYPRDYHKNLRRKQLFQPPITLSNFYNERSGVFDWINYLCHTNSIAAPASSFRPRKFNKFAPGMKIEIVDKLTPSLIRPATILNANEVFLTVLYEGFDKDYAYIVNDDDPDMHPPTWCARTLHTLEFPSNFINHDSALCRFPGCRGFGNVHSNKFVHSEMHECPLVKDNWKRNIAKIKMSHIIEDVSSSFFSYDEYNTTNENSRNESPSSFVEEYESEFVDDNSTDQMDMDWSENQEQQDEEEEKEGSIKEEPEPIKEEAVNLKKALEENLVSIPMEANIYYWTPEEVAKFLSTIPTLEPMGEYILKDLIDGTTFMELQMDDLQEIFDYDYIYATKINNLISYLKQDIYMVDRKRN